MIVDAEVKTRPPRLLSVSESGKLLDCPASWDFAYGDALAGSSLKPRDSRPILDNGSAWGAAVGAYHSSPALRISNAHANYLAVSLAEFGAAHALAIAERNAGVHLLELDPLEHAHARLWLEIRARSIPDEDADELRDELDHYAATSGERLNLTDLEAHRIVRIPSRTGHRGSNHYRLELYLDGIHTDPQGFAWIVEFKRRGNLTDLEGAARSRQLRWYAWAWQAITGTAVKGIILDERLSASPGPVKHNKGGDVSKVQSCHVNDYLAACAAIGQEADQDVANRLAAKAWQVRHEVRLRAAELADAGLELVAAAKLIRLHETGEVHPIRNAGPRCRSCDFRAACADPAEADLVDAFYERRPAKRNRSQREQVETVDVIT